MSIMLPEIDFERIGQRVKQARIDKGDVYKRQIKYSPAGELVKMSENYKKDMDRHFLSA